MIRILISFGFISSPVISLSGICLLCLNSFFCCRTNQLLARDTRRPVASHRPASTISTQRDSTTPEGPSRLPISRKKLCARIRTTYRTTGNNRGLKKRAHHDRSSRASARQKATQPGARRPSRVQRKEQAAAAAGGAAAQAERTAKRCGAQGWREYGGLLGD